jgi:hypothetical protein
MSTKPGMKVTTVRFGADLWQLLEQEAERAGVSVSQYVREAALARAAASAGARGTVPFGSLADAAREVSSTRGAGMDDKQRAIEVALASLARALAADNRDSAEALRGESRQKAARSQKLRSRSVKQRA